MSLQTPASWPNAVYTRSSAVAEIPRALRLIEYLLSHPGSLKVIRNDTVE